MELKKLNEYLFLADTPPMKRNRGGSSSRGNMISQSNPSMLGVRAVSLNRPGSASPSIVLLSGSRSGSGSRPSTSAMPSPPQSTNPHSTSASPLYISPGGSGTQSSTSSPLSISGSGSGRAMISSIGKLPDLPMKKSHQSLNTLDADGEGLRGSVGSIRTSQSQQSSGDSE
jgi:hypothetical protein